MDSLINELIVYGEKIRTKPTISPYSPLNINNFDEKYKIIETIYNNQLSPSTIYLAEDNCLKKVAVKQVQKNRLGKNYLHDFARNEMVIQQSLGRLSNNIVKVIDYYEDDNTYTMTMEYSQDASYFEDLLENVCY
jgi:serine/threonine protein kinase